MKIDSFSWTILMSSPNRDARGAAHHDPVLGAVMMHLQRQPSARFHHDALDLVAVDRYRGTGTSPMVGGRCRWSLMIFGATSLQLVHQNACMLFDAVDACATSMASSVATTTMFFDPAAALTCASSEVT